MLRAAGSLVAPKAPFWRRRRQNWRSWRQSSAVCAEYACWDHFYPLGQCFFYWLDWAPPYRPRSHWAGLASTLAEQVCSAERSSAIQLAPGQCSLASAFPTSSQHIPAQPDPAQPSTAQPSALDHSIPLSSSSSRLSLAQLILYAAQPRSMCWLRVQRVWK